MEGGRICSSVALPRVVAKSTVIEDNGEQVSLKEGEAIFLNLVSGISVPKYHDCPLISSLLSSTFRYLPATIPRPGLILRRSAWTAI